MDEDALAAALRHGRLAGAALDVFEPGPLRQDSPLWDLRQVFATPHIASPSEHVIPHQLALAKENLRRYLQGEPLLNPAPSERGY